MRHPAGEALPAPIDSPSKEVRIGKSLPSGLDIDLRAGLTDAVTPHAGVAPLIDLARRSGVAAAAERHLPAKRSPKGLGQGQFVESLVLLSALGGDCLDDLAHLRRDRGLAALLGYGPPAPATARQWLDHFHDPAALAGRPVQGSFIPAEPAALAGLAAVVRRTVAAYAAAARPERAVTLDVDAHLVESAKATALPTYAGFRGVQPALVSWAETGLVLADQLRDGNVPASVGLADLVDAAYEALPAGDWSVSVRSGSGSLRGTSARPLGGSRLAGRRERRHDPAAAAEIEALAPDAWSLFALEADGVVRGWAEVPFAPARRSERRDSEPYRDLAIRISPAQGTLVGKGTAARHFAVVMTTTGRPTAARSSPGTGQGGHDRAGPPDAQG